MNALNALYRDTIRRHAANPTGYRRGIEATHSCEGHNPQCGDGEACTICMASASLLCENLAGQTVAIVDVMARSLETRLKGPDQAGDDGPLAPLQGVRPYPSRIQCATLPWETAQRALANDP